MCFILYRFSVLYTKFSDMNYEAKFSGSVQTRQVFNTVWWLEHLWLSFAELTNFSA